MFSSRVALRALPFLVLYTNCIHSQPKDTSQLVAVLVVGYAEESTKDFIDQMNRVANFFTAHGVRVHKFYDRKAQWKLIAPVARDCNFFIYSGHGADVEKQYLPGMLCIDTMVSSVELRKSLKFTKKPLVIYKSACFGAGSSASDTKDIGIGEARRRVLGYARVYHDIGASAYYAVNYHDTVVKFLKMFFNGQALRDSVLKNILSDCKIETDTRHPSIKGYSYSIVSNNSSGTCTSITYFDDNRKVVNHFPCFKSYDIAYVGPPNLKLADIK
jgi:hypothetical protein